ncbi:ankyrin repeat domain-containing protein [Stenotrophomonas sp. Marseille-Q4652]|uniref:ankyrin repeat domain-containing protein n=1 Tax=Stenotrophomonas sp. Marseille-Q4652 TaxID=2866595 RepID=UPI001CE4B36F|nr:ankyrin repeat domain-containing protein [Stenotrophomonas sp. Marseille-Q4652]
MTDLHRAVEARDLSTLQRLLEEGADPNRRGGQVHPPLHRAAQLGDVEAVKALLAAGANPNSRGFWKQTPLMYAAQGEGDTSAAAAVLLNAGAKLSARDRSNDTALLCAVRTGHPNVSRLLAAASKSHHLETMLKQAPTAPASRGRL